MPASHAQQRFLPWLRQGITAAAQEEETLGADLPARLTLEVQLRTRAQDEPDRAASVPVRFYGPGDVIGIDPQGIVRAEPRPRSPSFEPNLFPFIEFDRPDFPWLFTPLRANGQGKLRPWLCLVVVPRASGARLEFEARRPLPVLHARLGELPDLAESWAWAHTQLTPLGVPDEPTIPELLETYPERTLSRLIAPRRLLPAQEYIACLVPTFAVGRLAGLGEPTPPDDEATLAPAWPLDESDGSETMVQLPVYYHWEFRTGVAGDFEALARRLKPRLLPPEVGVQRVDLHAPGWGLPTRELDDPAALMEMGGVLTTPTTEVAPWDAAARADFADRLAAILNAPAEVEGSATVKPPLYGIEYVRVTEIPGEGEGPHWFRELNSDPRYRIAAGLGGMVVRYEQERLMADAWKQLAAVSQAQAAQRRAEFSATISAALSAKRLEAFSFATEAPSGLRSLDGGEITVGRALLSPGNGSMARRLQLRGQAPLDAGAFVWESAAEAGARSLEGGPGDEPFRFSPTFGHATMEWLRDYFGFMLIPGLSQFPPDTIALLESDPALIEAFMVGMNHEMGRELLWREFPRDPRATYFRNFWGASADLPPIADWSESSHLGEHLTGGGTLPAPDPALEGQIEAAQDALLALTVEIATLEAQAAGLALDRDSVFGQGATARAQLAELREKVALIETYQFERELVQAAAPQLDAQAAEAEARAAALRASMAALLDELAALEAIAAQIPLREADRQARVDEIAALTDEIAGIPALIVQLTDQRAAAESARADASDAREALEAEVATIPAIQAQVDEAEARARDHEAAGAQARLEGNRISAEADPARQRLRDLEDLKAELPMLRQQEDAKRLEIYQQEQRIWNHRLLEPPPPDYPPDRALDDEPEMTRAPLPPEEPGGPLPPGDTDPIFIPIEDDGSGGPGLPGPGDTPYTDWYEWERDLRDLEAQLFNLMAELQLIVDKLESYNQQLAEIPALEAQVAAAEAAAAPHWAAGDAAYAAAAVETERAITLRGQIAEIHHRAQQIPVLMNEIARLGAEIEAIDARIEGMPDHQAALEDQRAAAEAAIPALDAEILALQEQSAGIPALQEQIAPIEALAQAEDAEALAHHQAADDAREREDELDAEIATLEGQVVALPDVEGAVAANEAAVAAVSAALAQVLDVQRARRADHQTASGTLMALQRERTMRGSRLVLLVRGELLRRFARARIYAVEGAGSGLGDDELQPLFRQSLGPDITLFGFALTGAQARGQDGHPGWYFVIEEPPTDVRFGLDADEGRRRAVSAIPSWDALSWDDLAEDEEELDALRYLPIGGRLAAAGAKPLSQAPNAVSAEWGRNSAHMALVTRQQPVRMIIHASVWLP